MLRQFIERLSHRVAIGLVLAAGATSVHAQGVQTGVLSGTVRGGDGLSLPGTTVTVTR